MKLELLTSFTKNTPHEALFFGVMAARSQMFAASAAVVVLTFNSRLRAVKRSILLRTLRGGHNISDSDLLLSLHYLQKL